MITAEEMLREKGGDVISVTKDTTVYAALEKMVAHKIGAIMVSDMGKFVGIWTERDLMRNTITAGFDPKETKVGDCMVTGLHTASHTDNAYQLMDKFLGLRIRHLLVEKEGDYIGLLSIGDVIKSNLTDKTDELNKLHAIVSWEYYENWRWKGSGK